MPSSCLRSTLAEVLYGLAIHDQVREEGHEAWVETLWVRPQWAASLALHALVGVAGSLAATEWPLPELEKKFSDACRQIGSGAATS